MDVSSLSIDSKSKNLPLEMKELQADELRTTSIKVTLETLRTAIWKVKWQIGETAKECHLSPMETMVQISSNFHISNQFLQQVKDGKRREKGKGRGGGVRVGFARNLHKTVLLETNMLIPENL